MFNKKPVYVVDTSTLLVQGVEPIVKKTSKYLRRPTSALQNKFNDTEFINGRFSLNQYDAKTKSFHTRAK